jgi:hypothetical protein
MAVQVLTNCYVLINSVDLSDHVESVELDIDVDDVESTNYGSGGWREYQSGLKKPSLKITFQQDYAASKVDATLWNALGTAVPFEVRETNSARSATNPAYTGSVRVNGYPTVVGGKVGELGKTQVTWPTTGAVTRATS